MAVVCPGTDEWKYSMTSTSAVPAPLRCRSQNAGQMPWPWGSLARISNRPYIGK